MPRVFFFYLHQLIGALEPRRRFTLSGREVFRLRGERFLPSRQRHKKETTCGFLLLVNHSLSLRKHGEICRAETIKERQLGYSCVYFAIYSQFTDSVLLHISANLRWVRHNNAAQLVYLAIIDGTCEFHLSVNSYLLTPNLHNLFILNSPLKNINFNYIK